MASASWCWVNGWNVRQNLNLCLLWCHVHTNSNDYFVHSSWFHVLIEHDVVSTFWRLLNNKYGSTCKRWACTRIKTPEQPSVAQCWNDWTHFIDFVDEQDVARFDFEPNIFTRKCSTGNNLSMGMRSVMINLKIVLVLWPLHFNARLTCKSWTLHR